MHVTQETLDQRKAALDAAELSKVQLRTAMMELDQCRRQFTPSYSQHAATWLRSRVPWPGEARARHVVAERSGEEPGQFIQTSFIA